MHLSSLPSHRAWRRTRGGRRGEHQLCSNSQCSRRRRIVATHNQQRHLFMWNICLLEMFKSHGELLRPTHHDQKIISDHDVSLLCSPNSALKVQLRMKEMGSTCPSHHMIFRRIIARPICGVLSIDMTPKLLGVLTESDYMQIYSVKCEQIILFSRGHIGILIVLHHCMRDLVTFI